MKRLLLKYGLLASFAMGVPFIAASPLRAQDFEWVEATIATVHEALDARRITCRELVGGYLARINAYDQAPPALNSIQNVNPHALARADSLDRTVAAGGRRGSLHCVPVLMKDQVETRELPTTYGSKLFLNFVPERNATIVERLEDAGAIILAKTTMGEFASRYVGSAYGIIRNVYDPTRHPSGSSGGSGSATAASFGLVGIGEDTGGSVRGPASATNLVGLRPTLPLVSRHGMMPATPTQDTMGPMTRSVTDAALVLDVIAGYDPNDPITAEAVGRIPNSYAEALRPDGLRGARIGILQTRLSVPPEFADEFAAVTAVLNGAVQDLRALGAEVVGPVTIAAVLNPSVTNNFETEGAIDQYLSQHANAPVSSLKEILLSGTVNPWRARGLVGAVGRTTEDLGYLDVVHQQETLRVAVLQAMADLELDALIYATFDAPPTPIAEDVLINPAPEDLYGLGDNRRLSPAIGFPALTVPAGFTTDGLPVGLEFLGRPFSEARLFEYGYAYEQGTRHRRPPAATPALQASDRR